MYKRKLLIQKEKGSVTRRCSNCLHRGHTKRTCQNLKALEQKKHKFLKPRAKRYKSNPEFLKKQKESQKRYYIRHKATLRMKSRKRMKKLRMQRKLDQENDDQDQ